VEIREIMTKDVVTLSPETTVKDAVDLLFKLKISGLPVVDSENLVVGMFTEKEVLKTILPSYVERFEGLTRMFGDKGLERRVMELEKMHVGDIMRREVICVEENAPIVEVAKIMLVRNARRVPVLKDSKLSGIVAREDILRSILGKAQKA